MVDIIGTLNIVDMLESKNDKIKVEKITKSKDEVSETINENEVDFKKSFQVTYFFLDVIIKKGYLLSKCLSCLTTCIDFDISK